MPKFETQIIIRESQLDSFGHVNNADYLQIFEDARWDLIVQRGFDLAHIRKSKTGPVILECNIKYLKELRSRDMITVTVENLGREPGAHPKIYKLKQEMIKSNGEVCCEAVFTYALFDLENRKLIEPTPEWRKAVGI